MGFTWTTNITVGTKVTLSVINEIKNNADYLDDNIVCLTHNATIESTQNTTADGAKDNTVQSTQNTTADSAKDNTVQATQNATADTGADVTVYTSQNASADGAQNGTVNSENVGSNYGFWNYSTGAPTCYVRMGCFGG